MNKSLGIISLSALLLFAVSAIAQTKVVIVPLGGAVGDAVASDVVSGKIFSSKAAGKGVTGTLSIPGRIFYTNSIGMIFSYIPAGSFFMGSPDNELQRNTIEVLHGVVFTQSFYMQTTEVTQGQWLQVMGSNPSYFTACGLDCPVEYVTWNDAQLFIAALNTSEGRIDCGTVPNTCYTLPTESQWEYAARAGTVTAFYSGDITYTDCTIDPNLDAIGWYCGNSAVTYSGCFDNSNRGGAACAGTHPVAQKAPNNWGLYDMSGNVSEWCSDWYYTYPKGPVVDPPPATGLDAVYRGRGGWNSYTYETRSASRGYTKYRSSTLGFRVALSPGQ